MRGFAPAVFAPAVFLGFLVGGGIARAAAPAIVGEVIVIPGDDEIIDVVSGNQSALKFPPTALTRRVLEAVGDKFQALTLWTTFDDRGNPGAAAFEHTIKIDVRGLGTPLRDSSRQYGSDGVLRSIVNMKRSALQTGDTQKSWESILPVWGQESSHRWMMFMKFIDPRTGKPSDALLGRQCSHYSRFVDTQASVHDGFAWTDNGDGTFTATGRALRFGNLDLYGMGLLPADEVPPFFLIDDIPGWKHPGCRDYDRVAAPQTSPVQGKRVDLSIDDIIAANGARQPSSDELLQGQPQDYFREAEVVITRIGEPADAVAVRTLVARIDKGRGYWEDWVRTASGNRLVICTKISADCGDPRADVIAVKRPQDQPPRGPATVFAIETRNSGTRDSSGVKATVRIHHESWTDDVVQTVDLGSLPALQTKTAKLTVNLRGLPCGAPIDVKARVDSDFHKSRLRRTFLVGGETSFIDGFETDSGWRVNPDGTDNTMGAPWERGRPEPDDQGGTDVQPDGAHQGDGAFVTGAKAGGRTPLVREGRTTLESPAIATVAMNQPRLRYWVSFAGVRGQPSGGIEPSPESRFLVEARSESADAPPGPFIEIDRLTNRITPGFIERVLTLPREIVQGGAIRLRFIAEDGNVMQGGAEAAIDDVEIISLVPGCEEKVTNGDGGPSPTPAVDSGGCACGILGRTPGAGSGPALFGFLLLGCALMRATVVRANRRQGKGG